MVEVGDYVEINGKVYVIKSESEINTMKEHVWTIDESSDSIAINELQEVEDTEKFVYAVRFYDVIEMGKNTDVVTPAQADIDVFVPLQAEFERQQNLTQHDKEALSKYNIEYDLFGLYESFYVDDGKIVIKTKDANALDSKQAILKYNDRFVDWYYSTWEDGGIYYVFTE